MSTRIRGDCSECKGSGREPCNHGERVPHWADGKDVGQKERYRCNGGLTCLACGGSGKLRDERDD